MEIKDLGYVNDWGGFDNGPEEFQKCSAARKAGEKHDIKSVSLVRCHSQTTCFTCGISWSVDSSD